MICTMRVKIVIKMYFYFFWGLSAKRSHQLGSNAYTFDIIVTYIIISLREYLTLSQEESSINLYDAFFWQTETIDLADDGSKSDRSQKMFRRNRDNKSMHSVIDSDGLPYVGQVCMKVSVLFLPFWLSKFYFYSYLT